MIVKEMETETVHFINSQPNSSDRTKTAIEKRNVQAQM